MRSEECKGFVEHWMPVTVERSIDRMPEKAEGMAVVIFRCMLPGFGQIRRLTCEKMPRCEVLPDFMLPEKHHR